MAAMQQAIFMQGYSKAQATSVLQQGYSKQQACSNIHVERLRNRGNTQ
jgi:hypothetical protein